MSFDPGDSSMNSDYGLSGGFKIGQDKQFGKNDASIGMSSGFGGKSRLGKEGLNSLYARGRQRRELKTRESGTANASGANDGKNNKPEKGLLEYNSSASVNSTIKKTIQIMDKNKAFDAFLTPGMQTAENKTRVAKGIIDNIEGKKVGWNSYVHKGKANDAARRALGGSVSELGGFKKLDSATRARTNRAVAGTIAELTRNKEIMRRTSHN